MRLASIRQPLPRCCSSHAIAETINCRRIGGTKNVLPSSVIAVPDDDDGDCGELGSLIVR